MSISVPMPLPATDEVDDAGLLAQYLAGEQAAFTALVERHAGLVFGVCRRLLQHVGDAEDAFQATFFVLARRAEALRQHVSLVGWLHETARRTALKLRHQRFRRRGREVDPQIAPPAASNERAPDQIAAGHELAALIDAELDRLPPLFREVLLLAQVEGLSREETAARLGVSVAAVKDRLERGREQLRQRLMRHGVTLSAGWLAASLFPAVAQASGAALAPATATAATHFATGTLSSGTAVTLAQGVMTMLAFEKWKTGLLTVLSMFAVGTLAYGMLVDNPSRFDHGLRGELVAVSHNGKLTTIVVKLDEFETLLSLDVAPQAKVWTAYEASRQDQLQAGQYLSLRLGDDHRTVTELHVSGRTQAVTIQGVTPQGKLLVTQASDDDDEEAQATKATRPVEEVALAPDAILRIGGLPATRDDLRPGMTVPLEFSPKGDAVNAIAAEVDQQQIVEGELAPEAFAAGQLRVLVEGEDDQLATRTYTLLQDALVRLDGKPVPPTQLQPGDRVTFRLMDGNNIRVLLATRPVPESDDND